MPIHRRFPLIPSLLLSTLIATGTSFAAPADHGPPPSGDDVVLGDKAPGLGVGCTEDPYEPDSRIAPIPINAGALEDLTLCAGNDDHWRLDVSPGMQLRIQIDFAHAAGDVDMTLHTMDYSVIAVSEGVTDQEVISYTVTEPETLLLRIYGYEGVANRYAMTIEIEDYSPGCSGDFFEPNDNSIEAAFLLDPTGEARICEGDVDWFAIELRAGEGFDFGIDYPREMGDLAIGLYADDGTGMPTRPLSQVQTSGQSAMVSLAEAQNAGRYYVQVFAPDGGFNRYTYSTARYAPGSGSSGIVTGRVTYEDQMQGADIIIGAEAVRWLPGRGVPVELVRSNDSRVLATAYTDEMGQYSLPFIHRAGGEAYVRVSARLEAPSYAMRVVDTEMTMTTHAAHSAPLSALPRDAVGNLQADFSFTAVSPQGGAFNITDRALDAFRFIEEHTDRGDLDLTVVWQRGRPHACASCFDNNTIYLGGGFDDPDEFDDSVILHEIGHFFVHNLSHDDSPGGNHNGDRTNPLVAYGEGIATVFALMVQGNPIYVDTMTSGGLNQDFEASPWPESRGTANGTQMGLVSEYLIVAAIWDLLDATAEPHDSLASGDEAVMNVLLNYMPTCQTRNAGVPGADFADFMAGYSELYAVHASGMDAILANYAFPLGGGVVASPGGGK